MNSSFIILLLLIKNNHLILLQTITNKLKHQKHTLITEAISDKEWKLVVNSWGDLKETKYHIFSSKKIRRNCFRNEGKWNLEMNVMHSPYH